MTTTPVPTPIAAPASRRVRTAQLRGLGTAVPPRRRTQAEVTEALASLWDLDPASARRFAGIARKTGIETRGVVLEPADVIDRGTRWRMAAYEREAPALATPAAAAALDRAGIAASQVTDLIIVSCTGFAAPGVDLALVEQLGLPLDVRRTVVGFMGCFGAIVGLRTAVGACAANPGAVALVVCVELCTLHLRGDTDVENQVVSALFADGAAAAVVTDVDADAGDAMIGELDFGVTRLIPEGRDWMSWRITDDGFAMTLAREVPAAVGAAVGRLHDGPDPTPATYVLHPGGPEIIDAAARGLYPGEPDRGFESARVILRRHGNMSSATVLFVLEESLRRGDPLPATLLAFGPGLTVESIGLRNPCFR